MTVDASIAALTPTEARALTDQIKVAVEGTWHLIERAYTSRAWTALGYSSWDDYCTREFGTARLRLPREERQEVVASLRESGLSTRAIAAATGLNQSTIVRDLPAGDANASPAAPASAPQDVPAWTAVEPREVARPTGRLADGQHRLAALTGQPTPPQTAPRVTGIDGKTYAPTRTEPAKPKRRPLGDAISDATRDLTRVTDRLARLTEDDRFPKSRDEAHRQMPELIRALENAAQFVQASTPGNAAANEEARRWWAASFHKLSDALAEIAHSIEQEK